MRLFVMANRSIMYSGLLFRANQRLALAALAFLAFASPSAHAALSTLEVGCPWIDGIDAEKKNTGYPDTHAAYNIVSIPVNPGPSTHYVIRASLPKARSISFQTYDGFRPGNLIDSLPDALITPVGGPPPATNPAVLPDSAGYTATYEVEVRYDNPPANPADRASNVVYAGKDSKKGALTKQLVYRVYLPNPGSDKRGDVGLPSVTYVGPRGEIDLRDTPEAGRCEQIRNGNANITTFPVVGYGVAQPKFKPVSGAKQYVYYPNGDIIYMRTQFAARYDDLAIIRAKMPVTPVLPPVVVPDPDVRYWSLCQNELRTSAVVECLADREMTVQPDGTINVVISKPEKRPANALPELGYDWLPHGSQDDAVAGFRQMLAKPSFAGNYAKALAAPNTSVDTTLGEWAPQITYCDRGTFEAHAGEGGAAVFAACRKAYKVWSDVSGLLPLP